MISVSRSASQSARPFPRNGTKNAFVHVWRHVPLMVLWTSTNCTCSNLWVIYKGPRTVCAKFVHFSAPCVIIEVLPLPLWIYLDLGIPNVYKYIYIYIYIYAPSFLPSFFLPSSFPSSYHFIWLLPTSSLTKEAHTSLLLWLRTTYSIIGSKQM